MKVWKYEALGNDYVVVDPTRTGLCSPALARAICDRHRGVGADGVLFGPLASEGFPFQIWNPDGSRAEKSGNGIRIFARFLRDLGYAPGERVTVTPPAGPVVCDYLDASGDRIAAGMGEPCFESRVIPVNVEAAEATNIDLRLGERRLVVHCVSMGNPHCVVCVPALDLTDVMKLGPELERHPLFPNRTNVQFVQVVSKNAIRIEIWERGAGYTQSSGTSSCAATAVCQRLGLVDDDVVVSMKGGTAHVQRRGSGLWLTGSVNPVFAGELAPSFIARYA